MTSNIDVQLSVQPDSGRAIIFAEDVPGVGQLSWPLDSDHLAELRDQLNDAWLNSYGLEMRSITAEKVERGDVILGLGGKVSITPTYTDSSMTFINIYLEPNSTRITLPTRAELTVHRLIQ